MRHAEVPLLPAAYLPVPKRSRHKYWDRCALSFSTLQDRTVHECCDREKQQMACDAGYSGTGCRFQTARCSYILSRAAPAGIG